MAAAIRTALRANEGAQAVFRLIVAFGAAGYEAALLLVRYEFDLTRAAFHLGLAEGCRACVRAKRTESRRGCDRCVGLLRQRVHRMQDRASAMLGDAMPTTRHRRPMIHYGADGRVARVADWFSREAEVSGPEGGEL